MKPLFARLLIICAVATILFFTNLGSVKLWDRDEPRNAGCAAEMLQRGDFVVPIFNDELRYQKPVMLYWLMISAYSIFGVNEFSARFWSAVLAMATTLVVYAAARRLFDSSTALLSSVVLSTSLMFCVAARAATPDSTLIFFSTLALAIYIIGTFVPRHQDQAPRLRCDGCWFPKNIGIVIAMYAAMGLGTLTKGPVAFLLPMAIIGMFLLVMRLPLADSGKAGAGRYAGWTAAIVTVARIFHPSHFWKTLTCMRPLTGTAVILVIAAPWFVLVDLRTEGDFTHLFFLTENFSRATSAFENHRGGLWYYPVSIAVGFFPWSVFLGPVALSLGAAFRQYGPNDRVSRQAPLVFLMCWVGVQVVVFSLAGTKLPSYVTPCYPALAMLTAFALTGWTRNRFGVSDSWFKLAYLCLGLTGLGLSAALGYAGNVFLVDKWWLALFGLVPLVGAAIALNAVRRSAREASVLTFAGSAIVFCTLLFGFGTAAVDSTRKTDIVLAPIKQAPTGQAVAAFGCLESSWVYYSKKPIFELDRRLPDSGSLNSLDRSALWKPKPRICPESFVAIHPDALLVTTDQHLEQLKLRLPDYYETAESVDFFLKKDRKLILLRPKHEASRIVRQRATEKLR